MKLKSLLASLLAMIVVHAAALAGTTGKIVGEVKDSQTGEALIGVSVVIEGTSMGAATNVDGYYVILNVPPGRYTVTAAAIGYTKKAVKDVGVSIDLTTTLDFKLQSTVVEVGEEVVVTAERKAIKRDLTSAEARVDASQIEKLAVREVSEVLTLQAGITTDPGGGIHIRGGRSSEVGYWVDGVSVSDVYDGSQAVQIDNNAVQELQVISGTFNAEYGQAMSGIVNIVTKDGEQQYHGNLSAYIGDYVTRDNVYYNLDKVRPLNTRNLEGSISGPATFIPGLTFYLSGRYFKTDGWLFGRQTFYPDGSLAPGADSVKDASGNLLYMNKPDNPVPMNDRERISGQMKLTYQISGTMKLSLSGVGSRIDYHNYDHAYVLDPYGIPNEYDRGYNVSALLTHSLDATSFYTLNLSFFDKNFKEHLYDDPYDPRYVIDPLKTATNLYEFLRAGTNLHQFKRNTQTRDAKLDFTSQVSRLHQVKAGAEVKLHRLYLEDYYITPVQDTVRVNGILNNIYRPTIPLATSPLYQEYTHTPVELSAYVQDKLEYERMVVNVGLRFDYFNSKGTVLADPQDPNVYLPQKPENQGLTLDQRMAKWYKTAKAKTAVSPRFGISYPITDRGILHFSYGHFYQIPSFEFLYQLPGYKVDAVNPLQGVYGNADLNPQRTIMYEFGLQQQLSEVLSFDVTGFYRDTRDWVSTSGKIPVRSAETATTYYTMFVNKDYENSRGVTLTVTKRPSDMFTLNFSYTFQTVEGSNSSPDEEQAALQNNNEPPKALTPLEWDQTHTVNFSLGIGPEDGGVFILGRYGSGYPYTPVINQAEARGEDAARGVQKNSRRKPETYTVDLRAFKNFSLSGFNFNVFLQVFNLFDRRNENTVYAQTGRAAVTLEQLGVAGLGGIGRVNTAEDYIVRPDFYTEPRQIQFGVDVNF